MAYRGLCGEERNFSVHCLVLISRHFKICILHCMMKDDVFLSVTQAYSDEKKNQSAPNRSRTYDFPISTSDALPLSYRRLVVERPLN